MALETTFTDSITRLRQGWGTTKFSHRLVRRRLGVGGCTRMCTDADNPLTANTRDERLGVELWILGAEAKKHFANLSAQKQDIEGKLGFELDWQELPDAKACRIASWYPHASIEEESRWGEYLDWLTQRLVKAELSCTEREPSLRDAAVVCSNLTTRCGVMGSKRRSLFLAAIDQVLRPIVKGLP